MLTCKLCSTRLEKRHLRRDGSLLCPECGQIYWKEAVDKAMADGYRFEPEVRKTRRPQQRVAYSRLRRA
ncbi:MAG: hypothetical protein IJV40_04595 [Oscillospiraceae bacterium]|nr:hypothetical protein [Oscillospiraceae bacterium]